MKWASAVSEEQNLEEALRECASQVRDGLGQGPPDLALVFVSAHFASQYESVPAIVGEHLGSTLLFGCSAGGVIGGGKEVEQRHGVSLTAAKLPGVELSAFHLHGDDLPDLDASPDAWEDAFNVTAQDDPGFVLLVDPFSFPAQNFLLGLDYAFAKSVKIGGLASGGSRGGENALFLGGKVHREGAIGLALKGNIIVDTVVAQGCRPVGKLMSITKSNQNLLQELDGRPPLEVLRQLFSESDEKDQGLMQHSLFLGVLMDDFIDSPQQGDFLIRNIIGMDARSGAMAVGEMLREGQRVRFHLRDALTSAEDLADLLVRYGSAERASPCEGALLFSCLGRGQYLYGRPDHDTELFADKVGVIPLGGFFCNGEIGQVSGTTFLHGYTSSFGIFRPMYGDK